MNDQPAQVTRYRFLQPVWPQMIDSWRDGINGLPAARRAVDSGASPEDVVQLARAVAYETVFAMLRHLAEGQSAEGSPGWSLAEVNSAGHLTGRALDALYEDLLTHDPSGQDGQDLWT
jgi:hypothetical protein